MRGNYEKEYGPDNLAQAIWKVKNIRSEEALAQCISKLRVFDILGQDDAGARLAKNFPDLFYIRATGVYGWQPPKNGSYPRTGIQSQGPLRAAYPDAKWATEGDTPAFMPVFPNGLNDPEKIDQGGWGGHFNLTKMAGIRSMSGVTRISQEAETRCDPYYLYGNTSEKAGAIQRWSKSYDNDQSSCDHKCAITESTLKNPTDKLIDIYSMKTLPDHRKPTQPVLGVIYGNRDFFPDQLVTEARADIAALFAQQEIRAIHLEEDESKLGGVETHGDARKCAELFARHRGEIDGVLVVLPNFGDEKGIADVLKMAELNVPVLIQAYPDDLDQLSPARRRDGFCGKISVCNNLAQAGIKFSLTRRHVLRPDGEDFREDLQRFLGVCRVVKGLRGLRLGAVGARPGAFNTVRYSEKILERQGISVTTVDLSEFLAAANKLDAAVPSVISKLKEIQSYAPAPGVPHDKLVQMARLGVVLDDWMASNAIAATAIQCWTSVQQNYGCNVCTLMSMMSERFMPSACEVDVTGVLTMYAMQLASNLPSALVDWNNNYGTEDDKCVLFHCGNWAKTFLPDIKIANAPILGSTLGVENTYGALEGRTPSGPLTFGRLTTDDNAGVIRAYVGEGTLTNDELKTFGNRAVAHVPKLQKLLRHICAKGFEHHVVMNLSHTAAVLEEAFGNYFGWEVHHHERPED